MTKSGKKMKRKRKVWNLYGIFKDRDILTNCQTGQNAIFSNKECAEGMKIVGNIKIVEVTVK